ncbi:MAG: hypothetical protein RMJ88_10190 [Thermogemmata sp.]|nr:hypothetical protein [Thermogemmata sp.]
MYSVLAGLLLSVAAPVPPPLETNNAPTGPAPTLLFLKADANGKVMVQVVRDVQEAVPVAPVQPGAGRAIALRQLRRQETVELGQVKDLTITTVDGRKVGLDEAIKRLEKGEVVLVAPANQPISPAYLKVFKDDTLILSSPELVGSGTIAVPGRVIQPKPVQIQPVVPPIIVPAQPGGVIEIQVGPAVEAIPAPAVPRAPVEKVLPPEKVAPQPNKVVPADKVVTPVQKVAPPATVERATPVEKLPVRSSKGDK